MFCAQGQASSWKEIWTNWTYDETLEFALELRESMKSRNEQLEQIEDPLARILTMLFYKITF
jgi:hypothetical protein